nr:DUF3043 domain-containing protein [Allobranchiibius huperziae]
MVEGVQGDAGDRGQGLQVGAYAGHQVRDPGGQSCGVLGPVVRGCGVGIGHGGHRSPDPRRIISVLGRSKSEPVTTSTPDPGEGVVLTKDGKKGRPTPKRREQQAARRQPLVPQDRKVAKTASREEQRKSRIAQREAMARGDESALMPRDRGPVKRYIRNFVDARLRIGEAVLPLMLIILIGSVALPSNLLKTNGLLVVWAIAVISVIDAAFMWRRLKKRIVESTGEAPPKGAWWYAGMRAFQMRFTRMPKPQVPRGIPLDDIPLPGRASGTVKTR